MVVDNGLNLTVLCYIIPYLKHRTSFSNRMENVKVLTKTISEIKRLADGIILQTLPLMKVIEVEENEYVESLIAEVPDLQSSQALQTLQDIVLEWVKDAEPIRTEVDVFIVYDDNSFKFKINTQRCPVLSEVWNGDAYGDGGVDGLKIFRDELKKQLEEISEENLIKKAKELLLGE